MVNLLQRITFDQNVLGGSAALLYAHHLVADELVLDRAAA